MTINETLNDLTYDELEEAKAEALNRGDWDIAELCEERMSGYDFS